MAIPTVVGIGSDTSAASSATYPLPAHQTDDILLLFVENQLTTGIPAPSGWAHVPNSPEPTGSNVTAANLLWKRAVSSSETNPFSSAATNHQVGFTAVIRGVQNSGNPYDTGGQGVSGANSTSFSLSGTSTTVDNCLVVLCATSAADDAADQFTSGFTNSSLANITMQHQFGTIIGSGGSVNMVTGEKATAGSTGTWSATQLTATQCDGIQIALVGASAATGVLSPTSPVLQAVNRSNVY